MDKDRYEFLWVTEFPMFEYSEEEGRYVAMHHPFTAPMDEDRDKLETDKASCRAKAYDALNAQIRAKRNGGKRKWLVSQVLTYQEKNVLRSD